MYKICPVFVPAHVQLKKPHINRCSHSIRDRFGNGFHAEIQIIFGIMYVYRQNCTLKTSFAESVLEPKPPGAAIFWMAPQPAPAGSCRKAQKKILCPCIIRELQSIFKDKYDSKRIFKQIIIMFIYSKRSVNVQQNISFYN